MTLAHLIDLFLSSDPEPEPRALSSWLVRGVVVAWGLVWGSFVNVVIHRLPRDLSVVWPGSRCPGCGSPLRTVDNIPVLSWILLRGRARCCGRRISARYVVVELLGGGIALAIYELMISRASMDSASALHAVGVFLVNFALAMGLLASAFIDAEHMYLPDTVTIGGTILGIVSCPFRGLPLFDSLFGAGVGFVGVWLPFVIGYKALRGRAGMGLGDAKLLMLAGAWFGWPGAAFAIFAGAIQATLAAIALFLVHGKVEEPESVRRDRDELEHAAAAGDEEAKRALEEDPLAVKPAPGLMAARMPFGPFLCLSILEWMLAGSWIKEQWLGVSG